MQGCWLLGYSVMASDAINYLIGEEEDRIINGADKGKGHNKDGVSGGWDAKKRQLALKISRSG